MDEEDAEHPWTLTYKDFIDRVCSNYGFRFYEASAVDPQGQRVKLPYLKSLDGRTIVPLPGNLEPTTRLDERTTASLCRRTGIPPEDFGLYPEEPYESIEWELN